MNIEAGHTYVAAGLDAGAAGLIVGAFMGWLPEIAAILAIVWYILQIKESKTVQGWLHKFHTYRNRRHKH